MTPGADIIRTLAAVIRAAPAELPPDVPDARAAEARLSGGIPALTG